VEGDWEDGEGNRNGDGDGDGDDSADVEGGRESGDIFGWW
jgi:hypothetical protein